MSDGSEDKQQSIKGFSAVCVVVTGIVLVVAIGCATSWFSLVAAREPAPAILERVLLTNKPRLDTRQYQYARFSNGLEVVNIHDNGTHTGGFAVAVEAGSFLDPANVQGLAHFCEHMLFLGTSKYPQPGDFDTFLNMHGGSSNAYTADEVTVYFAELDGKGFSEGLDRFADFFRAPLFDKSFVKKEVHAIDSEHAKNVQDPGWRVQAMMQSMANPSSPVGAFHTGDMKTLYTEPRSQGIDTIDVLRKYFAESYCPPRMHLVTFGKDPLQKQLKDAFDKFANINAGPHCVRDTPSFAMPKAYKSKHLGKFIHMKGTQPQGQIRVFFALPDLRNRYASGALSYLSYVLQYKGEGSLSYVLREDLGLITSVGANADESSAGTMLQVVFSLTSRGTENPELILSVFYKYAQTLQQKGVDHELYKSLAAIHKLQWDWAEHGDPSSAASDFAERMTRLPKQHLLDGDDLIMKPDPQLVMKLAGLLIPSNSNVGFVDPHFHETRNVSVLPHYGVKYTVEDLIPKTSSLEGSAFMRRLEQLDLDIQDMPVIKFPHAIKHIPDDINLDYAKAPLGEDEISKIYGQRPKMIVNSADEQQLWYRQGSTSTSPKVSLSFALRSTADEEEATARDSLLFTIYETLLGLKLQPKTVDLMATGISYSVAMGPRSLSFSFGGFKQNLPDMMRLILDEFKEGIRNIPSRFNRVVEDLREALQDKSDMPVHYAMSDLSLLLTKHKHSDLELLQALKTIKTEDVLPVAQNHLKSRSFQLTSLVMGNVAEAEATDLLDRFHDSFPTLKRTSISNVEKVVPVVKPDRPIEVRKHNPRADDPNHVTIVTLLIGVPDIGESAVFGILGEVLQPTVFEELRTNQQLGYVVSGSISMISNVAHVTVAVQGNVKTPDEIEPKIDMVLSKLVAAKLENMTDAEFDTYKQSYVKGLLEPPLGLSDEIGYFWSFAERGGTCPNRTVMLLNYLRNDLSDKTKLLEAWKRLTLPNPKENSRSRIVIKLFSQDRFPKIPQRKSLAQTKKDLEDLGVPKKAVEIAIAEYGSAIVLDKVDSQERAKLSVNASFFPTAIKCTTAAAKIKNAGHAVRRRRSKASFLSTLE